MPETWRPIPGYCDRYEASSLGNVRHIDRDRTIRGVLNRGYLRLAMPTGRKYQRRLVQKSHLIAAAFIGPRPDHFTVNHKDGQPLNNAPDNLEYLTVSDNLRHSWRVLGREPNAIGTQSHFAKLTDVDVVQIRALRSQGLTYAAIATNFNTKSANVWHICSRKTWKHLLNS